MRRILIAEKPGGGYGFPWKGDAPCFNFRVPDEHFRADEIDKIANKSEIETLVIGCELTNYNFISDMVNLRQLYIYSGENLSNLSFIKGLVCLQQLYIAQSHIESLEPFSALIAEKSRLYGESPQTIGDMLKYVFEAVCIRSDCLVCDPNDFRDSKVLRTGELIINNKRVRC